jgi:hypothetical protein
MKKFVALGNKCVEYLKAAKASEGEFLFLSLLILYAFLCSFLCSLLDFSLLLVELQML